MLVEIRQFESQDAEQVIAIWNASFPSVKPWNAPEAALVRKSTVDDMIWVACRDRQVVGAVMAGYDGVRGWIYSLAVEETHRRAGIGSQLLEYAEQALTEHGCEKVNLQVRTGNSEVTQFYSHCGFEVEDRISMGKALAQDTTNKSKLAPPTIDMGGEYVLAPPNPSDADALTEHLNASDLFERQTERIPYPYTHFDAVQWLGRVSKESVDKSASITWAIRDKDSDQLFGSICLMKIVRGHRAEVGYWLAQALWGSGITTRAVQAVCDYGFRELALKRIHANVFAFNTASAKVLTKAGFELEGRLRNEGLSRGEPADLLIYGKIAT